MERQSHAVLDTASRRKKALKIQRLLALEERPSPIRMLEIGTGSGGIAHYFGTHPELDCDVEAVDVHDNRVTEDGYVFRRVAGVQLPFAASSFDVVISNHVIEHVGTRDAQLEHLREIKRILAPGGIGYLAVPNRWMLMEPHYRVPFLSWLPRSWRTPYLRLLKAGAYYDCEPLQLGELEQMLLLAGFQYRNLCLAAARELIEIERPGGLLSRILKACPDRMFGPVRRIVPTLVYRIE